MKPQNKFLHICGLLAMMSGVILLLCGCAFHIGDKADAVPFRSYRGRPKPKDILYAHPLVRQT